MDATFNQKHIIVAILGNTDSCQTRTDWNDNENAREISKTFTNSKSQFIFDARLNFTTLIRKL